MFHPSNKLPKAVWLFAKIYALAIACFTCFRIILFLTQLKHIHSPVPVKNILLAFVMGWRFDTAIACYILLFPYLLYSIICCFKGSHYVARILIFWWLFIFFALSFLFAAIDIPYFNQFFSRLSITAFEWLDSPVFVAKMIAGDPLYWGILLPFIVLLVVFFKRLRKIILRSSMPPVTASPYLQVGVAVVATGLIVLGIRGRIDEKSPIRVGTANFCNNAFLNQLGLNANFTLMRSYLDEHRAENKKVHLMDEATAIKNVQQYLGIAVPDKRFPVLRNVHADTPANKYNVVVIIMESMSAAKLQRHGNTLHLTPFLDSLSNEGLYFDNTYSAGIHTFNGVFSTLCGNPALFRQHPMKESGLAHFNGIATTLKQKGYSTIYFTTHDGQFDNIEGFLWANDFDRIVTKADYPANKIVSTLGVPDDYLFEYAVPVLSGLQQKQQPFFAALMTVSDHGPYYIPPYFHPHNTEIKYQATEFADYSLRQFFKRAATQPWFSNTIFVLVADHGAAIDDTYETSLAYNHIPLLFYAPGIIKSKTTNSSMAAQIDVFPTIMGLLKQPYANNSFGIDLLAQTKPYSFFNADDKFGVIDKEWFLQEKEGQGIQLFHYQNKDTHNYASELPAKADSMKVYGESNLQAYQYVLTKQLQNSTAK